MTRIGIVAPASRIEPETAERATALARELYGGRVELVFHPQCFLSDNHFAGDDKVRADAFVEVANDPAFDALWWARGGYGANRIAENVLPRLAEVAGAKTYLGYSDAGFLLAGLYKHGFKAVHGPVAADINRKGGYAAVTRALKFLVERDPATLEPTVLTGEPVAAFNLCILSHIIGTPLMPDLTDHIVMLEDVSEETYRVDRSLFHVTSAPSFRKIAGLKCGRFSDVKPNDPEFGQSEEQVMRHWCRVSGIPYLGRADIGHDIANKIVPFGRWKSL
jgi:muramoyltetrapeptide carboxypeptidase